MEIKVLDNGFVRLEAQMGGDGAVLRAARVSYHSESVSEERDKKLIAYLLEHHHGTPFEHAVFTFHVKLPIFVARQWIRHRMSSYNETSFRYREAPEEFYIPEKWRRQDTKNKQASVDAELDNVGINEGLLEACKVARRTYGLMLQAGAAREMARMVLPVNLYTEWYWTVNARALMHFIGLRCENHAQWETRQYANALAQIFEKQMPWAAEAYFKSLNPERYEFLKTIE